MSADNHLIWIDLEMTGLDPDKERIIEIATIVTDQELNIVAEGPAMAVHQSDELLAAMDEWNTSHHTSSGLVDRVRKSEFDTKAAEQKTLEFLREHVTKGVSPICGNSVHQDRRFLVRYMPELEEYFHYRNLDVSTLKQLAKYWKPEVANGVKKDSKHLALDDIRDSINELRYYREHFINA